MFDFPASPALGDVSNGYVYNGMGWAGGPGVSGPQSEQIFDPAGVNALDIPVPSWAKGCVINGCVYVTGGVAVCLRLSSDGTTFHAGASDYTNMGPLHNTGSGGYTTQVAAASNTALLTTNADSPTVPHLFTAELNLVRPSASAYTHIKSYGKLYDSAAALQYRTVWWETLLGAGVQSGLAIKALRILHGTGGTVFPPGSYIHVKWLGTSAQIPVSNAITEAPQDGGEYTRVNGIWRLKSQSYTLDGLGYFDVQVPPTARTARIAVSVRLTSGYVGMRWSGDGTTFAAGASDYIYVGPYHYSGGTGSYGTQAASPNTFCPITPYADNVAIFHHSHALMAVQKNGGVFTLDYHGTSYNNAAAQAGLHYDWMCYSNNTFGGVNTLKALRFYPTVGVFTTGIVHLDWMY